MGPFDSAMLDAYTTKFRIITCIYIIGRGIARVKKIVQADYPGSFQPRARSEP